MNQFFSNLSDFIRAAEARSNENAESLILLLDAGRLGNAVGLLRQEIDTFIRLVYLSRIEETEVERLITAFVNGEQWRHCNGNRRITDREMVDIAKEQYSWVEVAYRFGCGLVHLSNLHDYENVDPFTQIPVEDKSEIVSYLGDYHGYRGLDIDMPRFIEMLPAVMQKICGKVASYSKALTRRFKSNG